MDTNKAMPLVSVVIPAYNAERFLCQTVASVVTQSFAAWELIIIDDGSRDGTFALAQQLAARDRRIRVVAKPNGGVAAARNTGCAAAHSASQYLLFLDHDDMLHTQALERLVAVLEQKPCASAVYGDVAVISGNGQPIDRAEFGVDLRRRYLEGWSFRTYGDGEDISAAGIIASDCILTPGVMLVRRSAIPEGGLFESRYDAYDDWMAFIELAWRGPIAYVPQVTLFYRLHESNQSKDIGKLRRGKRAILRHLIDSPTTTRDERHAACVAWMYMESGEIKTKLSYSGSELCQLHVAAAARQLARAVKSARYELEAAARYLMIVGSVGGFWM